MKDIYYAICWVKANRRGPRKILGKYETVEEAKKHYPTREEMARMMYEDVKKWEDKYVGNVMLLDDDDQFSIEMMGKGVSDYLGPRCCGQPLERVFDLDYIKWKDARKILKVANNEWENAFLKALAAIDKAIERNDGLYKWSKDEFKQGLIRGYENAYTLLHNCMVDMRKEIMEKEKTND